MSHRLVTFDDLRFGQRAEFTKIISEADIAAFVRLSGDSNPIHVDEAFANQTFFGGRIAHGMLTASMLSTVIGMHLPGVGAIYRSQSLEFLKPVRPGDELTASAEVVTLDRVGNRIGLQCAITRDQEVVLRGAAEVSLIRGFRNAESSS